MSSSQATEVTFYTAPRDGGPIVALIPLRAHTSFASSTSSVDRDVTGTTTSRASLRRSRSRSAPYVVPRPYSQRLRSSSLVPHGSRNRIPVAGPSRLRMVEAREPKVEQPKVEQPKAEQPKAEKKPKVEKDEEVIELVEEEVIELMDEEVQHHRAGMAAAPAPATAVEDGRLVQPDAVRPGPAPGFIQPQALPPVPVAAPPPHVGPAPALVAPIQLPATLPVLAAPQPPAIGAPPAIVPPGYPPVPGAPAAAVHDPAAVPHAGPAFVPAGLAPPPVGGAGLPFAQAAAAAHAALHDMYETAPSQTAVYGMNWTSLCYYRHGVRGQAIPEDRVPPPLPGHLRAQDDERVFIVFVNDYDPWAVPQVWIHERRGVVPAQWYRVLNGCCRLVDGREYYLCVDRARLVVRWLSQAYYKRVELSRKQPRRLRQ
ncbi:hypothetical protein K523DRAFT_325437 [Schizophyllum commune Tattone D]|nr:hypothetical protein K523DRAFT_325437 [Schizophyllum commune Tattone D]